MLETPYDHYHHVWCEQTDENLRCSARESLDEDVRVCVTNSH